MLQVGEQSVYRGKGREQQTCESLSTEAKERQVQEKLVWVCAGGLSPSGILLRF